LENDGDIWTATVMYENCGDGHPQYIDYVKPNSLILCGEGKTLLKALNVLESRIISYLGE